MVFIDGVEMLNHPAFKKFSDSLNLAKNLVGKTCDRCNLEPIFGGVLVVLIAGGRYFAEVQPFLDTAAGARSSIYRYPVEPEPCLPVVRYTAPTTNNPGLDRCKAVEMRGMVERYLLYIF